MKLADKICIVTGGATGIGQGISQTLAKEGAKVAITGRREDIVHKAVEEILQAGGSAIAIPGDVTNEADSARMVSETISHYGSLDVLVNCAGAIARNTLLDSSLDSWRQVMDVNVTGIFLLSRAAIEHMKDNGGGTIVNVTSISGVLGEVEKPSYSASKAAANNLTRSMALECAPFNIRVNAVLPGLVRTAMSETRIKEGQTWDDVAGSQWIPNIPLGRTGTPEDIAKGVVFLASEDSAWVTGSLLTIDGGVSAAL